MIKRFLFVVVCVALFSASLGATDAIVYVNTDNVGTENGDTLATGWKTLATALSNETTALTQDMVILCSGATADTGTGADVSMDTNGFVLTIQGNRSEADGFYAGDLDWSTSHYRLTPATGHGLRVDGKEVVVDGIQVRGAAGFTNAIIAVAAAGAGTRQIVIKNNRVRANNAFTNHGIAATVDNNSAEFWIQNNIVQGATGSSSSGINVFWTAFFTNGDAYITNNTVFNNTNGIILNDSGNDATSAVVVVQNNAVANNTNDYNPLTLAFTPTLSYNANDDGDMGTSEQDISPGGTESDDWEDSWTAPNASVESKDFTPVETGVLPDNGTTGTGILTTDILGETRDGSTPTIGAFEFIGGGGGGGVIPPTLLRGNGLNAGGLRR